jgi:hypothetical protein
LASPTRLSIVGLLWRILFCPTQERTVPPAGIGKKVTFDKNTKVANYFDKSSAQISNLVYKT